MLCSVADRTSASDFQALEPSELLLMSVLQLVNVLPGVSIYSGLVTALAAAWLALGPFQCERRMIPPDIHGQCEQNVVALAATGCNIQVGGFKKIGCSSEGCSWNLRWRTRMGK